MERSAQFEGRNQTVTQNRAEDAPVSASSSKGLRVDVMSASAAVRGTASLRLRDAEVSKRFEIASAM